MYLSVSGRICSYLNVFLPYLTVFEHIWPYLTVFEHIWLYLNIWTHLIVTIRSKSDGCFRDLTMRKNDGAIKSSARPLFTLCVLPRLPIRFNQIGQSPFLFPQPPPSSIPTQVACDWLPMTVIGCLCLWLAGSAYQCLPVTAEYTQQQ